MIINVKIYSGIGADLGPNFVVTTDVGTVNYNYTLAELLAGVQITVEDNATFIIISSLGICTNSLYLPVSGGGTTTSTTTESPVSTTSTTTTNIPYIGNIRMDYINADIVTFSDISNNSEQNLFSISSNGTSGNIYYIAFRLYNIGGLTIYPETPVIINDTSGEFSINTITGQASLSNGESYDTTVRFNASAISTGTYTCTFRQEFSINGEPSIFFDVNLTIQIGM